MTEAPNHEPARIIDASSNRAREAIRVLEDGARFLLDDESLCRTFKTLRHELVGALALLPGGMLSASRATEGDVGRSISLPTETRRADARAVLEASASRLGEALRSIEEWSKTVDPGVAVQVEALRYRGYEATGALLDALAIPAPQWKLCVLVTRAACLLPAEELVRSIVAAGADCIQIREKGGGDGALLEWIETVISIARPAGTAVVVNDRVDLALAAGADGVHVGTGDLPVAEVRRIAGRRLLVGASTHDLAEAESAIRAGCDTCGLGAMYATSTKPGIVPSGPDYLSSFLAAHPETPHLAIGGIDPERARALAALGCRGVAVSSVVCGSERPDRVVEALLEALAPEATVST